MITIKLHIILYLLYSLLASQHTIRVQGNANQQIQVIFPFQSLLKITVNNRDIPNYVQLVAQRFKLHNRKQTKVLPIIQKNLQSELRSPFSNTYDDLLSLGPLLVTFQHPNQFIIMHELSNSFVKMKQLKFTEMLGKKSTILVVQDTYLMVILSKDQLILFNQTGVHKQINPFNSDHYFSLSYLFQKEKHLFFTILNNTIFFLTIKQGIITVQKTEKINKGIQIEVSAFQKGKSFKKKQQIWLVDQNRGLFLMIVTNKFQVISRPVLMSSQQGCFELDTKSQKHSFKVLLTCRQKEGTRFLIVSFDNDNKNYPFLLSTSSPFSQKCNAQKYSFFQDYIYSQQIQTIDIYTPGKPVNNQAIFHKNEVTLTETDNFIIIENSQKEVLYIYTLEKGVVSKKQLVHEDFNLVISSEQPINSQLQLTVDYLCYNSQTRVNEVCSEIVFVKLNIHNNIVSYIQYKSFNIGIALILITSAVALGFLCRYKYKSMQNKAYKQFKELTNPGK